MKNLIILTISGVILLVALLGAAFLTLSGGGASREAMTAANNLYLAGHYAESAQIYQQMVAQGSRDSRVYYNLGNAYYQQGDLPNALLNYEQAAALSPRDGDIQANLALAQEQARETLPVETSSALNSLASAGSNWLSLNELALLALASWFGLAFTLLALRLLHANRLQSILRPALVAALLFFLVFSASLAGRLYSASQAPEIPGVHTGLAIDLDALPELE